MAIEAVSKKDQVMTRFGKLAAGALMLAGTTAGATLVTTAPADAHITVGIGIGIPGAAYYGGNPCYNARYRYYHPEYCGYTQNYGQGYNDQGYYGSGYNAPVGNGLWLTNAWGHRRWRDGDSRFHGGDGDHRHGGWRGDNNRGFQRGEHDGGHWNGGDNHQSGGRGDGEHDHGDGNWHH